MHEAYRFVGSWNHRRCGACLIGEVGDQRQVPPEGKATTIEVTCDWTYEVRPRPRTGTEPRKFKTSFTRNRRNHATLAIVENRYKRLQHLIKRAPLDQSPGSSPYVRFVSSRLEPCMEDKKTAPLYGPA